MDLDVEIYKDRMVVKRDGITQTFFPISSFSTTRLLVGNFLVAQNCLKAALKEIGGFSILGLGRPGLRIHPKECIEGGLSEIELRILRELGHGAGAKKVEVIVDGRSLEAGVR